MFTSFTCSFTFQQKLMQNYITFFVLCRKKVAQKPSLHSCLFLLSASSVLFAQDEMQKMEEIARALRRSVDLVGRTLVPRNRSQISEMVDGGRRSMLCYYLVRSSSWFGQVWYTSYEAEQFVCDMIEVWRMGYGNVTWFNPFSVTQMGWNVLENML